MIIDIVSPTPRTEMQTVQQKQQQAPLFRLPQQTLGSQLLSSTDCSSRSLRTPRLLPHSQNHPLRQTQTKQHPHIFSKPQQQHQQQQQKQQQKQQQGVTTTCCFDQYCCCCCCYYCCCCCCCPEEAVQQEQQDKLSVLHCRLQQEADKIRKWKNSVELELRQKDRQLQEVQELVNSKQNTLLETQVREREQSQQ